MSKEAECFVLFAHASSVKDGVIYDLAFFEGIGDGQAATVVSSILLFLIDPTMYLFHQRGVCFTRIVGGVGGLSRALMPPP